MSQFLRLLSEKDKGQALRDVCNHFRQGQLDLRSFDVAPDSFDAVPGKPFAYWVSEAVRNTFQRLPAFESDGRVAQHGGSTKDDFRFLRLRWENTSARNKWFLFAKGGAYSPFYSDIYLAVNWQDDARELEAALLHKYPYLGETANWVLHRECNYLDPGITWPGRTQLFGPRALPSNCLFSHRGCAAFHQSNSAEELLSLLSIMSSRAFHALVELRLNAADKTARSFEVGIIQDTPVPVVNNTQKQALALLARQAWSLKRTLDTNSESSHAFVLPAVLLDRLGKYVPSAIQSKLVQIQAEIDDICFDLYDFTEADRQAANGITREEDSADNDIEDDEDSEIEVPHIDALLSWAVGVAFGRFDLRLAISERAASGEPEPFDPLPAKSPGMLPDGAEPFHRHAGILVDDQGHPHDLARLVEEVLIRVDVSVPSDVRRWLQKDFFAFHLQRYSKSRRKAPIYWPLATASGSYTLWVYYPSLNSQTLFTAVNDFLDGSNGKLTQVSRECADLRMKGSSRSRDEEKQYETLQTFEQELADLRDTLLKIAPTYQPNHDDGVQITAAPLWPLFRHKPWQKILKDTWTKLEKGDYEWAHLAMTYWPERVREKCKTDKSLAIAHALENLYFEPEPKSMKTRNKN